MRWRIRRIGRYFRLLLVGHFEGLDSERGIAWRSADSLAVRTFLGLGLEDASPDHSAISRTRRLIDVDTHRAVFTWVQERLVEAKLLRGQTVGIDVTTMEANAAMRSIVRRDTGEGYVAFLTKLAEASGVQTPTREALARFDRKRKKKGANGSARRAPRAGSPGGRPGERARPRGPATGPSEEEAGRTLPALPLTR